MKISTVGIDLAKNVFSVHGVGKDGKVVLRRTVGRADLLPMFAQIEPCLIGMKACSGAHHFARELRKLGHDARIMAPRFVAPYRKSGKNDGNDDFSTAFSARLQTPSFDPPKHRGDLPG